MRKIIVSLWVAVICARTFCGTARGEGTNLPITFYAVREEQTEGDRFFDGFPFPKLGYISSKPDLAVAHLKSVSLEQTRVQGATIVNKATGETRKGTMFIKPRLVFALLDEDARRLKDLKPVGNRLLVLFGERPLTLIRIGGEEAQAALFRTSLNTADEAVLARVESELKKLVR